MKIAIGNDHAAGELKPVIIDLIKELGNEIIDVGVAAGEAVDYPIPGEKVGRLVASGEADLGVLICGTGVGISLAANKVKGIRAAAVSDTATARLIREHNNANVIAIGARIVGSELAKDIIKTFLTTDFSGEERHQRRIDLISDVEERFGK
ncbi:MAG: ribose 5-phosphate isomerase B [Lachnospiraceae bacterium]|nr:ribose 5-phosphate isomerase B [Lachnospiraceae bacterium]MDD7178016.1 ribose 5-phosphate isomerase B [bacterium]MDY5516415.1 ribose 5-phosphate isomerase B [Lachnospiraceae bacterium]